jgi:hypothetical protein
MNELIINESTTFNREYEKLSARLQGQVETEVISFSNNWKKNPKTFTQQYDRHASFNNKILELKPTQADRLFAHWEPDKLTLLRVGGHDTTKKLTNSNLDKLLSTAKPARTTLQGKSISNFFKRGASTYKSFSDENLDSWSYSLGKEQTTLVEDLTFSIWEAVQKEKLVNHVVLGGPGTGKTIVLLNLLKHFQDIELSVKVKISSSLQKQLSRSLPIDWVKFEVTDESADILLIDDPADFDFFEEEDREQHTVVIAFLDPLQMQCAPTDENLREINATQHILTECYRQKNEVGQAALESINQIAQSSPYFIYEKQVLYKQAYKKVTQISNDLTFVNPGGYTNSHEDADISSLKEEITRLKIAPKSRALEWLLVAFLDIKSSKAPLWLKNELNVLQNKYKITLVDPTELDNVKGLEFQHAFCFMTTKLFEELNEGFSGSSVRIYEERRRLRIPITRAKDSVVLFALS